MVRPSVEGQDARLLAVEPLLQQQAVAGLAEDAADHHLVDGVERLAEVVADIDALAPGEPVGLDDHAQRPAEHVLAGLRGRGERPPLPPLLELDVHAPARAARAGSMIRSIASSVSAAVRQCSVWRRVERPLERTTSETSRERT